MLYSRNRGRILKLYTEGVGCVSLVLGTLYYCHFASEQKYLKFQFAKTNPTSFVHKFLAST
jgi:hypothetical protein